MLKLNLESLANREAWAEKGIKLPEYDIDKMRENTKANPVWLHFGAGNIFRGFIAVLQQRLLNEGLAESGIIAADTFDYDMIDKIYKPYDNLVLNVGLKADGNTSMEVVASLAEAVKGDFNDANERQRLMAIIAAPSLQMVSFTITEKGYALRDMEGNLLEIVKQDMTAGPQKPHHAMSVVTALLWERFQKGAQPIALCSMDNCSHNGEKLKTSVTEIACAWKDNGLVSEEFLAYIGDESRVSFPWSMIDKITPRPAKEIEDMLENLGIADMKPVITNRNTYIAAFVNAEIPQYLVMEDRFPNGRPALEKAGVYLTDRDTVNKTEKMKVTTCLNPLHTAMAVYGCLLGYDHIAKEMQDKDIYTLVEQIGYVEGLPVVTDPQIIHPKDFIDEVMKERLPNLYIPDMPQRIATDTSMKIPIRFGETIKSYLAAPDKDVKSLTFIPLAIAGWFRYLLGVNDAGEKMELSADPMLAELTAKLSGIAFDDASTYHGELKEILANETIFATDLCKAGLADTIEDIFKELLAGPGAVRATLHKYAQQVS
ncbi:MAG: mannitol dehydrogenase family protein [Lachnospiraceae bacterium]|nr:mannitol dehydrogenase family protein [Lachnospiraceae bacterium]